MYNCTSHFNFSKKKFSIKIVFQLFGVICAFMLAKTIRRTKSLRAARAWQVQQGLGILPDGFSKPDYENYTQLEKSDQHIEPVTYQSK